MLLLLCSNLCHESAFHSGGLNGSLARLRSMRLIISLHDRLICPAVTYRAVKGVFGVKRVKSACILQTLVFSQKPELGHSCEVNLKLNRGEFDQYKKTLERTGTRYQILNEAEEQDGSLVIHVRKQYNDKADVSEYFT